MVQVQSSIDERADNLRIVRQCSRAEILHEDVATVHVRLIDIVLQLVEVLLAVRSGLYVLFNKFHYLR